MSRYAKGRRAEWKARDWLLAKVPGSHVIRSAGSKGPVDLVHLTHLGIRLYQVKAGAKRPAPAPRCVDWAVDVLWFPPRASEPVVINQFDESQRRAA